MCLRPLRTQSMNALTMQDKRLPRFSRGTFAQALSVICSSGSGRAGRSLVVRDSGHRLRRVAALRRSEVIHRQVAPVGCVAGTGRSRRHG